MSPDHAASEDPQQDRPDEPPRSWVHELYVFEEPDDQPRSGRPAEQPYPRLAQYVPFVHLLVLSARRYGLHVVGGVGIGTVVFVSVAIVSGVLDAPGTSASLLGFGSFLVSGLVTAGSRVAASPWIIVGVFALVYSVHVWLYTEYLEKLRRDEEAILSFLSDHVPLEEQERWEEQWLRPSTRSVRMRERTGPAFWMELAVWSVLGLVLGGCLTLALVDEASVPSLGMIPGWAWMLGFAIVAVLVSRTLHLVLIEDAVRGVGAWGPAAGWRLGARVPLVYLAGLLVFGTPSVVPHEVSVVVILVTPVVGSAYLVARLLGRWRGSGESVSG